MASGEATWVMAVKKPSMTRLAKTRLPISSANRVEGTPKVLIRPRNGFSRTRSVS